MTPSEYFNKRKELLNQINRLQAELIIIKRGYIEERRMISQGQEVIYAGEKWWFTGNCTININGDLLYELDGKSRFLIYKLFDDFEVVE